MSDQRSIPGSTKSGPMKTNEEIDAELTETRKTRTKFFRVTNPTAARLTAADKLAEACEALLALAVDDENERRKRGVVSIYAPRIIDNAESALAEWKKATP